MHQAATSCRQRRTRYRRDSHWSASMWWCAASVLTGNVAERTEVCTLLGSSAVTGAATRSTARFGGISLTETPPNGWAGMFKNRRTNAPPNPTAEPVEAASVSVSSARSVSRRHLVPCTRPKAGRAIMTWGRYLHGARPRPEDRFRHCYLPLGPAIVRFSPQNG